jgi:hypothetical protein
MQNDAVTVHPLPKREADPMFASDLPLFWLYVLIELIPGGPVKRTKEMIKQDK